MSSLCDIKHTLVGTERGEGERGRMTEREKERERKSESERQSLKADNQHQYITISNTTQADRKLNLISKLTQCGWAYEFYHDTCMKKQVLFVHMKLIHL